MLKHLSVAIATMAICFNVSARQPQLPPAPIAQKLQVEVVRGPEEMAVVVPQTASAVGMQFGLIGGLIGGAIQDQQAKNAEARIVPLRDMLAEYRFYDRVEQALRVRLASEGISPEPQFDIRNADWQSGGSVQPEALIVSSSYAMEYDFGQMNVSMTAQWVKRTTKPNGKTDLDVLFMRNYTYSFPMRTGTQAERGAKWAGLGRERLVALMDEAADQLVDMLVFDFSGEGRATWQAKIGNKEFVRVNDVGFPGRPIRQEQDWAWVRVGKKWPMLRGYHPIVAATYATRPPVDVVAVPAQATPVEQVPVASPMPAGDTTGAAPASAAEGG